ncbi:glycosyl hydrolase [Tessaracoccus sp. G1721]
MQRRISLGVAATASVSLAAALLVGPTALAAPPGQAPQGTAFSAIDPAQFAQPDIEYRPGVRWWWPGNGATKADLLAQVDYLYENGFGAVEIVAFAKGFQTGNGTSNGYIYDGLDLGYDNDQILSYESPDYFDKLDAVVARANELGITVDLNIGSGYLASDDSIEVADSQSNMALGRATINVAQDGTVSVTSGDIAAALSGTDVVVGVPGAEMSPFYASEKFGFDFGVWSPEDTRLNAVIVAPIAAAGAALTTNNQVINAAGDAVKTYPSQTVLDLADAAVTYPGEGATTITAGALAAGSYEVIALYSVPSGSYGLNAIIENTTTDKRNYVVDHLDPDAIEKLVDGWLGNDALREIVDERDIRAAFNDSYEFYTDAFYNDVVQSAATSEELLGYDITPYIPTFYALFKESFLIDGNPTIKDEYSALGLNDLVLARFGGVRPELLTSTLTADESSRIEYDYGRLLDGAFRSGMEAFSDSLADYDIVYRQQAYNPPVDTLKSASVVDIPETEGLDEYSLKRVASGAHLYGRNLVTSEVYTLGSTPFTVTPDFIKRGYDLMATSGVNNFFYHGLNAPYDGNDDPTFTSDDNLFSEEGWRAWPTIGVEMAETSSTSGYFEQMNAYASRANYVMQAGRASSDVAVYMPLFGALASGGGFGGGSTPLAVIDALQDNGYAWDAINDDTIQTGLTWENGQLIANGNISFDALVVQSSSVPVETMSALADLKAQGAPIYFYGDLPARQPGYANGDYQAADAETAAIAEAMGDVVDAAGLSVAMAGLDAAPITYGVNDDLRFSRRTLETGGELAYIRNTASEATAINLSVSAELPNCYWLDQETGSIHRAAADDGVVSATLNANGAVILLCEPKQSPIQPGQLTAGTPASLDATPSAFSMNLTDFTLEVTADNIGTMLPGATQSATYTASVLGDWTAVGKFDGDLRNVTDAGTYRTTVNIPSKAKLKEGVVLDLGVVGNAATVRVNPGTKKAFEAQVFHAPFTLDIGDALQPGKNVIEIEVQPVKNNRRVALRELYLSDPGTYGQYRMYPSVHGRNTRMPAGLVGPVVLRSTVSLEVTTPR